MNKKYLQLSVLIAMLALSACSKNKHEEDVATGDLVAHISYGRQWLSDSESSVAAYKFKRFSLFGQSFYKPLDEDFFKKELDIAYNPGDYGGDAIMAFPHKKMLIFGLGGSSDGHSIIGIMQKNGEPHVVTLAGCFPSGNGSVFTLLGRQVAPFCDSSSDKTDLKNYGTLYKKLQISEHQGYWVDYKTEDVVEIPENSFNLEGSCLQNPRAAESVIGVAGLDSTRQHLLMLYKTKVNNTFNLCAISAAKGLVDSTYQCFNFQANNSPPKDQKSTEKAHPPVPASMHMEFDVGDDKAVEARAQWVASYFDFTSATDGKPLKVKTGTKVIATETGTIARDRVSAEQERKKGMCNYYE